jgi:hypothetical protein
MILLKKNSLLLGAVDNGNNLPSQETQRKTRRFFCPKAADKNGGNLQQPAEQIDIIPFHNKIH